MCDSVTHLKDVTICEPKQRICTIDILVSDAVTHYENVTKSYTFFRFVERNGPVWCGTLRHIFRIGQVVSQRKKIYYGHFFQGRCDTL